MGAAAGGAGGGGAAEELVHEHMQVLWLESGRVSPAHNLQVFYIRIPDVNSLSNPCC